MVTPVYFSESGANSTIVEYHFANSEWFDYFFKPDQWLLSVIEDPNSSEYITFELNNGVLKNVEVSQTAYSSARRDFTITPINFVVNMDDACVFTKWRMDTQLDVLGSLVNIADAYGNVARVSPEFTIVATAADLINQFLDTSVTTNRMDVTLKYTLTTNGDVRCELFAVE